MKDWETGGWLVCFIAL